MNIEELKLIAEVITELGAEGKDVALAWLAVPVVRTLVACGTWYLVIKLLLTGAQAITREVTNAARASKLARSLRNRLVTHSNDYTQVTEVEYDRVEKEVQDLLETRDRLTKNVVTLSKKLEEYSGAGNERQEVRD